MIVLLSRCILEGCLYSLECFSGDVHNGSWHWKSILVRFYTSSQKCLLVEYGRMPQVVTGRNIHFASPDKAMIRGQILAGFSCI